MTTNDTQPAAIDIDSLPAIAIAHCLKTSKGLPISDDDNRAIQYWCEEKGVTLKEVFRMVAADAR